jgi:hypothetical protein
MSSSNTSSFQVELELDISPHPPLPTSRILPFSFTSLSGSCDMPFDELCDTPPGFRPVRSVRGINDYINDKLRATHLCQNPATPNVVQASPVLELVLLGPED